MADILFVQNYYEQMLGIMQISAVLKQNGFSTDVAIGTEQSIISKVLDCKPKVVGFYCTTGFHHKNISIAAAIKKICGNDILTLFGGPHPTLVPDMINANGVDIICRGEGEFAVLDLLMALKEGQEYTGIENLFVKKDGQVFQNPLRPLCDLNSLPHFDREIYRNIDYIYGASRQEVMLGRGCPFNCSFCSAEALSKLYGGNGSYARLRSVSTVMEELKAIKTRYNPGCFFFHDDTIIFNKNYCEEFFVAYKEQIDLPFSCLIRADLATEDSIRLLKMAGCYMVSFGVESGNQGFRTTVLGKIVSDEQILECAGLLHTYKIPFNTFNMVGMPGENLDQVWETIDMNVRIKPEWAWFSVYQTLPQTRLASYALEKGYLLSVDVAEKDASFHENGMILRNNPETKKIYRLKNCANIIVKFPIIKNPVKGLFLQLPLDPLLEAVDKLMYFFCYYSKLTYKNGFFKTLYSAGFLARHIKEFK